MRGPQPKGEILQIILQHCLGLNIRYPFSRGKNYLLEFNLLNENNTFLIINRSSLIVLKAKSTIEFTNQCLALSS